MRRFVINTLAGAAMLVGLPSIANAQTSFLFGLGMGYMLGSGDTTLSGNGPNVLYLMPRGAERVKDPLEVRQRSDCGWWRGQMTVRENFESLMGPSQKGKYEIIQILRIPQPSDPERICMWVTFIDKEKVTPLEKLPPLAENKK